jgi:alkylation response protein AidB-like acyl-CoA dehydrogenase
MRFAFDPDQLLIRNSLRDMLEKECTPKQVRAAWNTERARIPGLWAHLVELGVIGMSAPEAVGGLGMDALDSVLVLEECGRALVPEPVLETAAVGIPLLADASSTSEAARSWLSRAASGEAVLSVGLSHSPYVLAGDEATLLLLEREGALFAVPQVSLQLVRQPSVDGARRLFRVDGGLSATARIAEGARAREIAATAVDRGALGAAAELLGIAGKLIELGVEYAKVRRQFGAPIGSFQAVKHQLADAKLGLEFARPVVYRAAYSLAKRATDAGLHVSMAKAVASDAAMSASRVALQVHGAIGYSFEYDLMLYMKRAWALAADWGDAAWHRARVGALILDRPRPTASASISQGEASR